MLTGREPRAESIGLSLRLDSVSGSHVVHLPETVDETLWVKHQYLEVCVRRREGGSHGGGGGGGREGERGEGGREREREGEGKGGREREGGREEGGREREGEGGKERYNIHVHVVTIREEKEGKREAVMEVGKSTRVREKGHLLLCQHNPSFTVPE